MATFSSDSATQTKPDEQLEHLGTVPDREDITIGPSDDGMVVMVTRVLKDNSMIYHMFTPELAMAISWAIRDAARQAAIFRGVNKPEEDK